MWETGIWQQAAALGRPKQGFQRGITRLIPAHGGGGTSGPGGVVRRGSRALLGVLFLRSCALEDGAHFL